MTVDKDKLIKLGQAFTFVVKNETYAVNRAALIIQREVDKGGDEYDHTEVWEAAYSILTHSANLSKIFWPPISNRWSDEKKDEFARRGQFMRTLFDVTDSSPLHDRKVRNGFEHLDERLHEWLDLDDDFESVIDYFLGPLTEYKLYQNKLIFRSFDHKTGLVVVGYGAFVNLHHLIDECDRLYEKWREIRGMPPHPKPDQAAEA